MMVKHSTLGSSFSFLGGPSSQSETLLSLPSTAMWVTSTEMARILKSENQSLSDTDDRAPIVVSPEPDLLRSLQSPAELVRQD